MFRLRDAIEAADDRRAAGGLQHGAEDSQGGRLAGAVGPKQAVDLAGRSAEKLTSHSASTSPRTRSEYALVRDRASIIADNLRSRRCILANARGEATLQARTPILEFSLSQRAGAAKMA